ncbi:PREDICTED: somatostatin receptor type 2-like [Nicrophorus vespilloides]|uniref:Somatostatin receptor type 2-like n=1 Tax=Nicrophorus vespilloides TaxID=110193 RepID=A0ABM1MGF9_NICVS|nr:PREDICTED: somatostatin receptor type 2-like [Nicrophorus vespilloides]
MESLNETIESDVDHLVESAGLKWFLQFFRIELLLSCLIGLCADCLIVYVILQSKRMLKSHTNLVILNWAIVDGVFLFLIPFNYRLFSNNINNFLFQNKTMACMLTNSDVSIYLIVFSLILLLTVDRAIKGSNTKLLVYLMAFIYTTFLFLWAVSSTVCSIFNTHIMGYEQLAFVLIILMLILNITVKQIWRCCRKHKASKSSVLRLNIATIFICNWTLSIVSILVTHLTPAVFLVIFGVAGYLNSVFILMYLIRNDVNYKICFLTLFRMNSDRYEVSAAISFAESCSEDCDSSLNVRFLNEERTEQDVFVV